MSDASDEWASAGSWEAPAPINVAARPGVRQAGSFGPVFERGDRGVVAGRFLPPHRGHAYVIDFARAWCRHVVVLVAATPNDAIPGAARARWLQDHFPDVAVHAIELDVGPTHASYPEKFVAAIFDRHVKQRDHWFGSEATHELVMRQLQGHDIPVDPGRVAVPISGTAMRANIVDHFAQLLPSARPWFVRRIAVIGAPSTGKSTLCARLRATFTATLVPAPTLPTATSASIQIASIEQLARTQVALEDALAVDGERGLLVVDTDLYTTYLTARRLGAGEPPAWIRQQALARPYDLYLWCREGEQTFDAELATYLAQKGDRVIALYGSPDERFRAAAAAVRGLTSPTRLLAARGTALARAAGWL